MDNARHVIALLVVVFVPAALPFWLLVHPFVRFWRKLGLFWTYTIYGLLFALIAGALYRLRAPLLAIDFGASPGLIALGAALFVLSLWMDIVRRGQATSRMLVGVQELSPEGSPGKLATDGIYSRLRHPRYVSGAMSLLAWSMFSNYLAASTPCSDTATDCPDSASTDCGRAITGCSTFTTTLVGVSSGTLGK